LPKKQSNFIIVEGDDLKAYLDKLEPKEGGARTTATSTTTGVPGSEPGAGGDGGGGGAMETD
jgi:hypothetical protein